MGIDQHLTNGDLSHNLEPIAIVGIGLRLPGKIHSAEALWEILVNKKDTRGPVPPSRYNSDGFYSPSGRAGTVGVKHGHFLDESDGLGLLDTSFFTMSKPEVEKLDPQQRMLLEVVWECMENGGQSNWRGTNTGVFVGTWGDDWQDFLAKDPQQIGGMLNVSGAGDFAISNRISYEYDLRGPSMTIKAACASAMICLHEACQSLRNGECDAAIVAGSNLITTPTQTIAQTEAGVLSPTGQCRTFDASANGYARGEAINAILVKKLSDAIRDGDSIRGVVRATSVNCDGRSAGISSPNPEAHERMIRYAYRMADIVRASDTPFVEVHGTGTPSGDPLELQAIAKVFGAEQDTYVGSVKANVGHGEGASGLTSVIKALMSLENGIIPPQVNFSTPNPKIPFEEARLLVPLDPVPWPANRPERISVNSFGITGANAHAIIESARSYYDTDRQASATVPAITSNAEAPNLLVLSANTTESLKRRIADIQKYISLHPSRSHDLAYTLACRREHLPHRAYCIVRGASAGEVSVVERVKDIPPNVNFVFTGQGAQWAGMAKELVQQFPDFRADLAHLTTVLALLPHPPTWNLLDELAKPASESRLNEAELAQPLCTAIQVAIVNLLRRLGVFPSAVVGHSSGEIAAAYAANALTADEAIIAAYYRGLVSVSSARLGAMAAVGIGRAEAALYLERGVVVACDNSPNSVTLSGDRDVLENIIEDIRRDDDKLFVRMLKTDGMAYHSHHMLPLGQTYEDHLSPLVKAQPPSVPFFSSVTGKLASATTFGPQYWRQNLESPVKFFPAIRALIASQESDQFFLEIGPHSALSGPIRQIFGASASKGRRTYLASLVRGANAVDSVLEMAGQLFLKSIPVQLEHLTSSGRTLTDIPNYPWQHENVLWNEPRVVKEWRTRPFPPHELLGSRIIESSDLEPMWRNMLRLKDAAWLRDHKVLDDVVFPCAGYVGMIGEAIRRVTGVEVFSIRRLNISTALILTDERSAEIITSFKPVRSTTTVNSVWYDFSIYSHNGSAWTRHCDGQARGGRDEQIELESELDMEPLPRKVASPYAIFDRVGLNYGPTFQGIQRLSVKPGHRTATADFQAPPVTGSPYSLHPTTIDQCLQLLGLAAADGLSRHLEHILLPTGIDHLYIQPGQAQATLRARARAAEDPAKVSNIKGEMVAAKDGQILLSAQGCKVSVFEQALDDDKDSRIAAARLSWRPDLDFVPLDSLMISPAKDLTAIQVAERYVLLCTVEMQRRIKDSGCVPTGYMEKFRQWIDNHVEEGHNGHHKLLPDSQELLKLGLEDRLALIRTLREELKTSEFVHVAELVTRLLDSCVDVFLGQTQILDVYLQEKALTKMYAITGDRIDSSEFFATAGHTNPRMRVLEIGAGTGGTTLVTLQALHSINGERMYSNYTFTDISSGFFSTARERFAEYSGLEFKTLDISRDPLEQGFEAGSYDLIIASNVIHATPSLNTTLKHVRKLLHSRGRFFLQELIPSPAKMINLIMGPLSGWWLGDVDGRQWEPIVSTERWDRELSAAGFSGIETVVHDDPQRDGVLGVNMIARPAQPLPNFLRITLLIRDSQKELQVVQLMEETLASQGYQVDRCTFGEDIPPYQDIISLLEVDSPFTGSMSSDGLETLQRILKNLGASRIIWVMGSAQFGSASPEYGLTLGLTRSVRTEFSVPIATLETDAFNSKTTQVVVDVFRKFQDTAASVNPDYEFVVKDNTVHVGRYHWAKVSQELATAPKDLLRQALRLQEKKSSGSNVYNWVPFSPSPPGPDEVVVKPAYAGVTFKDTIAGEADFLLGREGSGTVTAIGSSVQTVNVGDRVMMLGERCLDTTVTIPSHHLVRIPDDLSFDEAATMPLAYATAIYCLINVANLQRGQAILIHSACEDVGLAALQICQMTGAQVYCTVGNNDEVEYLTGSLDIPRENIFHSKDATFLTSLMKETNNRGVDVVLNSLSGDVLQVSWQCVAKRGKMIHVGGPNSFDHTELNMSLFTGNRSFVSVDMADLQDMYHDLLSQIVTLHHKGHIKPISPVQAFEADDITNMASTIHKRETIGKSVVQALHEPQNLKRSLGAQELELRGNASYLLVGGLGGLGQAISTCMVEHGARHFIYLSRSAGSSEDYADFFSELESQGCSVQAFSGDVANIDDVTRVVQEAKHPIAGVLQMAMVLRDHPFLEMPHEDWKAALKPKVDGTWNLHNTLVDQNLDFFVIFGSISGSFGIGHQANYAAANTFQDAFVQYRHAQGLPASILNIGAMADVGYVSQRRSVQDYFRNAGMPFLSEGDLFETLHLSIRQQLPDSNQDSGPGTSPGFTSTSQLALGIRATKPMDDPTNRTLWKHDRRVDIYRNIEASRIESGDGGRMGGEEDVLTALMKEVRSNPSTLGKAETLETLTHEVGINIYSFMLLPVEDLDVSKSMMALGVDSLVVIEIRNWLRRKLEVETSTLEILNGGTIEILGKIVAQRLKEKYGGLAPET
ncbi:hypothetical protein AJ80_08325 [Polytolypa hystricis UAMH7299]|uniref:Non-reducing polyketide synthase nscA n=1 Tax=Polytolypa hystricis (strain UAMH7299) TaxID=1447883 RepID=A0A2B7X1K9_POLH7|nr:hypothetical protein AJ80_08325 [Polytolypa hystricis UAMH7299]